MLKKIILFLAIFVATLQARIVLDTEGNKIEIPEHITYAMAYATPMVQIAAMLTEQEKIISGSTRLPPLYAKIFPKIRTNYNPSGSLASSIESIIAAKPQVVFGPTDYLLGEHGKKQLNAAGIPVVNTVKFRTFASIDDIRQSVNLIAEIFGGQSIERAKEFNKYLDDNINFVGERVKKINPKKRVLMLSFSSGNFSTSSAGSTGVAYIEISGGINVSTENGKNEFKGSSIINEEQVIIFNPDIILTHSQEGFKKITENPAFKELKAVKNKQIFIVPSGLHVWNARSAETAIYPLWLAKTLYPDEFKDLDIKQKTKEFYKQFYHYDLSDEEVKSILYPKKTF